MVEADDPLSNPIVFAFLDRRVLLSLEQVIQEVRHVTGENLTFADLTRMGDCGWIPMLRNPSNLGVKLGIPLYGPSRIGLLFELQRKGYSENELQIIANWEELTIDLLLNEYDMSYAASDLSDLEVIIRHLKMRVQQAEQGGGDVFMFKFLNRSVSEVKQRISLYEKFQLEGIPETRESQIAESAFWVRGFIEGVRLFVLEKYRGQISAGYSPFIGTKTSGAGVDEFFMFEPQDIDWDQTIRSAIGHMKEDVPTIRVPGFLLRGDTVVSLKTLSPRKYHQLWHHHDLGQYLLRWSTLQGEKRCLNCLSKLLDFPSSRRLYCDEKCRNALKQRRFRIAHPEAVFEIQRKYYSTLGE